MSFHINTNQRSKTLGSPQHHRGQPQLKAVLACGCAENLPPHLGWSRAACSKFWADEEAGAASERTHVNQRLSVASRSLSPLQACGRGGEHSPPLDAKRSFEGFKAAPGSQATHTPRPLDQSAIPQPAILIPLSHKARDVSVSFAAGCNPKTMRGPRRSTLDNDTWAM